MPAQKPTLAALRDGIDREASRLSLLEALVSTAAHGADRGPGLTDAEGGTIDLAAAFAHIATEIREASYRLHELAEQPARETPPRHRKAVPLRVVK